MVTTTDGHAEAIVWSVGAGDLIGSVRRYQTPILAGGRIFIAADNTVKAFVRNSGQSRSRQ